MENAADALKIAFAVLIFIIALTLAFSTITKAKDAADTVLFVNDKTNYHDELEDTDEEPYLTVDGVIVGRLVGMDTIISSINRCKNETIVVSIIDGSNTQTFDSATDKGELVKNINDFVKNNINRGDKYLEQFAEAKYSGKLITSEVDGSSIVVTKGGSKMYITYTKQ